MKLLKEHQYLLMQRESRVVLGRHAVNLWLLLLVLTATFLAIAFSAGCMAYLNEKMNDPFTYWLNVYKDSRQVNLRHIADGLEEDSTFMNNFFFDDVQTEIASSIDMFGYKKNKYDLFKIQHYEDLGSDLIKKVLDGDNVVTIEGKVLSVDPDSISERSLGVIMTLDAIERLGYGKDNVPAYVDCRIPTKDADTLGFVSSDGYVRAPLPLLAVVRRLPMNKDIIASKYLYVQYTDHSTDPEPFNMNNKDYARLLYFYVPSELTDFDQGVLDCLPDSMRDMAMVKVTETRIQERLHSWRPGCLKTVYPPGLPAISTINDIERAILEKYAQRGVSRVYNYKESLKEINGELEIDNGLSIHFNKLDSIRSFERFMKDKWSLQIEMTQVNSKENFNAVSTMANILTIALLLFSIISIIIFIVNMMQSYFQKVKRNLGTFKAFGISTSELTKVYVVIIVGIVVVALVVAMAIVWITEMILPLKEGEFKYIILWNSMTMWAVLIILISTICSVLIVMRRLLRQTPGDLIYDR